MAESLCQVLHKGNAYMLENFYEPTSPYTVSALVKQMQPSAKDHFVARVVEAGFAGARDTVRVGDAFVSESTLFTASTLRFVVHDVACASVGAALGACASFFRPEGLMACARKGATIAKDYTSQVTQPALLGASLLLLAGVVPIKLALGFILAMSGAAAGALTEVMYRAVFAAIPSREGDHGKFFSPAPNEGFWVLGARS